MRRATTLAASTLLLATLLVPPGALAAPPGSAYPGSNGTVVERTDSDGKVPTVRWRGANRHDTAALMARHAFEPSSVALVARGDDFPDSLAGSYLAGQLESPVLLTRSDEVPSETLAALADIDAETVVILGGPAAVSATVGDRLRAEGYDVVRVAGEHRYDTAARIAGAGAANGEVGTVGGDATAIVASGENFPDALVAGALAYDADLPLLLTRKDSVPPETLDVLDDLGIEQVVIPGGPAAVSEGVAQTLRNRGLTVVRRAGEDRVSTALSVAQFAVDALGWGFAALDLAVGSNFPDALSLGPVAGSRQVPIVLSRGPATLDAPGTSALVDFLTARGCDVELLGIAGGPAAISVSLEDQARDALADAADCVLGLSLDPDQATRRVGAAHTLTATVTDDAGDGQDGHEVTFEVYRSVNEGGSFARDPLVAGADTTSDDADDDGDEATEDAGQATFDYTGPATPAFDRVVSCLDLDGDGCASTTPDGQIVLDEDDASTTTADVRWETPTAATITLEPADATAPLGTTHGLVAEVTDQFGGAVKDAEVLLEVYRSTDGGTTFAADPVRERSDDTGDDLDDDGDSANEARGEATFDYVGPLEESVDHVVACLDLDGDDACAEVTGGQVVAQTDDVTTTAEVTWVPGEPDSFSLSPAEDTNPVGTRHLVRARVTDAEGDGAPGIEVTFEVYRSTDAGETFAAVEGEDGVDTTGDNLDDDNQQSEEGPGEASFDYTGPEQPALDTIVACIDLDDDGCASVDGDGQVVLDADDDKADTASKAWEFGDPAEITLDPAEATNPVATDHTVTGTLTDAFGNALDEQTVTFEVYRSTDAGQNFAQVDVPGDGSAMTDTTGDDLDDDGDEVDGGEDAGEATFDYTGPEQPAVDTIVACVDVDDDGCASVGEGDVVLDSDDDAQATLSKTWEPGPPAQITLTQVAQTQPAGATHNATAKLIDEHGNPIEGEAVTFEVYRSTEGGDFADAGESLEVITDANGNAPFEYEGPDDDATDEIVACVDSGADGCATVEGSGPGTVTPDADDVNDSVTVVWEVPGGDQITDLTTSADPSTVGDPRTVTATVQDQFGQSIEGATVTFEVFRDADGDGEFTNETPSEADSTPGTDEFGDAVFTYTGTVAGRDIVVACLDEGEDGCATGSTGGVEFDPNQDAGTVSQVDVTWDPGVAALVTLSQQSDPNTVGDPHVVTAEVTDQFGNVTDGAVTFEVYHSDDGTPPFEKVDVNGDGSPVTDDSGDDVDDDGDAVDGGEETGEATFDYTSTQSGMDKIVGCIDDGDGCATLDGTGDVVPDDGAGMVEKTWEPGPAAALVVSDNDPSNPATPPHSTGYEVTATVTDEHGNLIDEDETILFDVWRSTDSGSTYSSGQTGSAQTGTDGTATFLVDSPMTDGVRDQVIACIDASGGADRCSSLSNFQPVEDPDDEPLIDTAYISWEAPEATTLDLVIDGDGTSTSALTGEQQTVIATVRDQAGEPLGGVSVRMEIYHADDGETFGGPNVPTPDPQTQSGTGEADHQYASQTDGLDKVVACVEMDDETPDDSVCSTLSNDGEVVLDPDEEAASLVKVVEITWQERVPDSLTLPEQTTVDASTTHTVEATVKDQATDPVPFDGAQVTFEVYNIPHAEGAVTQESTGTDITGDGDPSGEGPGVATFEIAAPNSRADHLVVACINDGGGCAEIVEGELVIDESLIHATHAVAWRVPGEPEEIALRSLVGQDSNFIGVEHIIVAAVTDGFGDDIPPPDDMGAGSALVRFEAWRQEADGTWAQQSLEGAAKHRTDLTGDMTDDDGDDAPLEEGHEATFDYAASTDGDDVIVACIDVEGDGCTGIDIDDAGVHTLELDPDDIAKTKDLTITWEDPIPGAP